ncbi:MAG: chaperone modulator CbpM [Gammaproteobacteria bacterium]|nr:chaperone modulator CbpM [Gammaproteobacteria bacterium]MDH3374825.1 chaperone modulator CbpM [Gammaproteobacteria bacterium]MDH3409016.1 chaperone modulator CbpM [Gammaproteobacteria bacterium]MDH3551500.1 chaperone modulator CbpM [Gammaproteobacteria bacterium]
MNRRTVTGIVLDEQVFYSLKDICQVCGSQKEWVFELVEQGVLHPTGEEEQQWQFSGSSLHTAMKARRLQRDLDLNLSGVVLVLELLEEIESLRSRLGMLASNNEPTAAL